MPVWVLMNEAPLDSVVRQVVDHATPSDCFKPDLAAQFVEYPDGTEVKANWRLQGDGSFLPPPAPEPGPAPEPPAPAIFRVDFMQLFTSAERVAIRKAVKPEHATYDEVVEDWWLILQEIETVDLGHANTIAAVNYLEAAGFIDTGRAAIILANTPPS